MTAKAAFLEQVGQPFVIREVDKPTPSSGQVLIRNHFVASNPVDWKIKGSGAFVTLPAVLGSDSSGVVEAIGEGVSHLQVGDRVWAYSSYAYGSQASTFQTHTLASAVSVQRLPSNITLEEGATIGLGSGSAAGGLFVNLGLSVPSSDPSPKDEILLVWGASSSVGSYSVQIAHLLGYRVFATSSPKFFDAIKQIGAEKVFDYRAPDVVDQIKSAADGKIFAVLDAISEKETVQKSAEILGKGKLVTSLPSDLKIPDIEISMLWGNGVLLPGNEEKRSFYPWFNKHLESGKVKIFPPPVLVGHGLEALDGALDKHKAGVSGQKLIVQLV
eukprot:TRINITY_DN7701_c0_g2_i3.p1 TRINITY_DN7701_c0_g2~~TRINITY_DN7701_c0_g2_i3.p1  ORF type:complete len:329 (-),score=90.15 TRINITY_DN7701_c0_g2_i3:41-1027(-)